MVYPVLLRRALWSIREGKNWLKWGWQKSGDQITRSHEVIYVYLTNVNWIYMYAAAKSLQSCLTLCDPRDGSPPGSPVPGISRQEHWSGLPFPSPMHESETWKWSHSVVSDSWRPHGLQSTRLLRPQDFPGKSTGVGCHCLLPVCMLLQ